MTRVLRVEWNGDIGYRVMGGVRLSRHYEGVGFTLDAFGWRLEVTWHGIRDWGRPPVVHWDEPPRSAWWILDLIEFHFSPAYGGYLAQR
jgi:hypothetical protein